MQITKYICHVIITRYFIANSQWSDVGSTYIWGSRSLRDVPRELPGCPLFTTCNFSVCYLSCGCCGYGVWWPWCDIKVKCFLLTHVLCVCLSLYVCVCVCLSVCISVSSSLPPPCLFSELTCVLSHSSRFLWIAEKLKPTACKMANDVPPDLGYVLIIINHTLLINY